ncbi:MAG: GerMN domain-containing protein [Clostridium sp.]
MKHLKKLLLSLCIPFILISCNTTKDASNSATDTSKLNVTEIQSEIIESAYEKDSSNKTEDNVKLYLYSASADKFFYITSTLNKTDEDLHTKLFELLKTTPHNSLIKNIPNSVTLNSVQLNEDSIFVDISSNFVHDSNLGSSIEGNILQCIANTFSDATNVSKVKLLLDGKPYSSGHYSMKDNEFLTISTDGINEFDIK